MIIDGFGISGYRSFNEEFEYIKDLSTVNIFIGKNNSGKSNILRFCQHLSKLDLNHPYKALDKNLNSCYEMNEKDIKFAWQIKRTSKNTGSIYQNISEMLPSIVSNFPEWKDSIWLKFSFNELSNGRKVNDIGVTELSNKIRNIYNEQITNDLAGRYLGYREGGHDKRSLDLANKIYGNLDLSYDVKYIGAFRQITNNGSEESAINGSGLVRKLRKLQSPSIEDYSKGKEKFNLINSFLKELINEKDAFIEIPAEPDDIYVSIKNKILPLNSLGTGIHELIILAAAVTIEENTVFCIEEPEIHIHQSLQKKFINYILEKTENQYLITTHSNAFLDIPNINIYHCNLVNQSTKCNLVASNIDKYGILSDLGYKPSDLLLSNFIIWVEGPSDRIYLNHWIHEKEPKLFENYHYNIMFYGGRLLSHLTYDSPEIEEFVQLSKLNHNAAIVIDSDKGALDSDLNQTKKRVIENFQKNNCHVWVTDGKEIENYIPEELFNKAIKEVHPQKGFFVEWGQFNNITKIKEGSTIDKVSIAKYIASNKSDYSRLDLEKQIDKLIECIKNANK